MIDVRNGIKRIAILKGYKGSPVPSQRAFRTKAMEFLQGCSNIQCETVFEIDGNLTAPLSEFDAVITRPLWGALLTERMLKNVKDGFVVASLSAGVDHITKEARDKILPLREDKGRNANALAELTVWQAITLRRRLHIKLFEMAWGHGYDKEYDNLGTLRGCVWLLLGRGKTALATLYLLPGLGVSKAIIYNRRMARQEFEHINRKAWEKVYPSVYVTPEELNNRFNESVKVSEENDGTFRATWGTSFELIATTELEKFLSSADIISNHLTLETGPTNSTEGFLNTERCKKVNKRAIIINAGRGRHIDSEEELVGLLQEESFAGLGCDGLKPDAEIGGLISKSEIWQHFCNASLSCLGRVWSQRPSEQKSISDVLDEFRNTLCPKTEVLDESRVGGILVTQHLGAAASDAEEMVASEIVGRLLLKLGLINESQRFAAQLHTAGYKDIAQAITEYSRQAI